MGRGLREARHGHEQDDRQRLRHHDLQRDDLLGPDQGVRGHLDRRRETASALRRGGRPSTPRAAPADPPQAPPTPTGLALAAGDGQFTATWNASPGAGTYIIQYGVDGARLQLAVYVRPGTATSRTIASTNIVTISNGTTYRARISACSGTAPPRDLGTAASTARG